MAAIALPVPLQGAVTVVLVDVITDVIVETLRSNGVPGAAKMRPVVRALVRASLEQVHRVSEVYQVPAAVMARLGINGHVQEAKTVLRSRLLELKCPIKGTSVLIDGEDGTYTCPACEYEIEISGREYEHAEPIRVECPVSGDMIDLGNDGEYECLACEADIVVKDGEAEHAAMLAYTCPESGAECHVVEDVDGWFECSDCGSDVLVYGDESGIGVAHQIPVT